MSKNYTKNLKLQYSNKVLYLLIFYRNTLLFLDICRFPKIHGFICIEGI